MRRPLAATVFGLGFVPSGCLGWLTWSSMQPGGLMASGQQLVVRDYLWLWAAGKLLAAHDVAAIFTPDRFGAYLKGIFGQQLEQYAWSYPPSMLFLAIPAGHWPILVEFAVYMVIQFGVLWSVGRLACQSHSLWFAVLVSLAALEAILAGQNGALTSALLVGGLLLADARPLLAGVLFGLLTVKPQLGLLVPVCLLAARNWRALVAATVTAAALVVASSLVFGLQSWILFWQNTRPFMTWILQRDWGGEYYQRIMVTVFAAARSLGLGLATSEALQAAVGLLAAVCVWRLWSRPSTDVGARMAATVCCSLLATPYAYNYDVICLAASVVLLAASTRSLAGAAVLALAWLWPGLTVWASLSGLQWFSPALLAAVAIMAYRRASGIASPVPISTAVPSLPASDAEI